MRLKTVFSGILAGVGLYFSLMRLAYDSLPAKFITGWRTPVWDGVPSETQIALVVYGFAALSLMIGGWLAATWNKTQRLDDALAAGAGAGLIAGALGFSLVGGAWAGLLAQGEIYLNLGRNLSEKEGYQLILNEVSQTASQTPIMFWQFMIPAILLGTLGGFLAVLETRKEWKTVPRLESGWLYRLPAYTLTISGLVSFVMMFVVVNALQESATETLFNNMLAAPDLPPQVMLFVTSLTAIPLFLVPFLISLVWLLKGGKENQKNWVLSVLWVLVLGASVYYLSNNIFQYMLNLSALLDLKTFLGIWFAATLILGSIFLLTRTPHDEKVRFSGADWLGFALTQGILGGTQFMSGTVSFALSLVFITGTNIATLLNQPTDELPSPPIEQVKELFRIQQGATLVIIGGMTLIAFVMGLVAVFLRAITGANRSPAPKPIKPKPYTQ